MNSRLATPAPGTERRWCHVAGCGERPTLGYNVYLHGKVCDEIHVCAAHRAQGEAAFNARAGKDLKLPDPETRAPEVRRKDLFGGNL
jgi:hypothetical protein